MGRLVQSILGLGSIDQFGFKSMASAIPGGLPRQTKDDAMPQAYTCSWTKAVHSLKYSSFVMLLEAPQIWRMKRYNVLETELVYRQWVLQWKLDVTRSLEPGHIVIYFVISVVNKQYKTKEIISLGPEKLVCYIRYFVISIRPLYIEFPLYSKIKSSSMG